MTAWLIPLAVIVAAFAAAAALLLRSRGQHRSGERSSPPSRLEQVLDDHDRDVPLRGPDPREEDQR